MLLVSDTGKSLDFSAAWTMSAHDKSITHQDFVIWIWGLIVFFFFFCLTSICMLGQHVTK